MEFGIGVFVASRASYKRGVITSPNSRIQICLNNRHCWPSLKPLYILVFRFEVTRSPFSVANILSFEPFPRFLRESNPRTISDRYRSKIRNIFHPLKTDFGHWITLLLQSQSRRSKRHATKPRSHRRLCAYRYPQSICLQL